MAWRSADAADLVALGKSIVDDDAQLHYRKWVVAIDSMCIRSSRPCTRNKFNSWSFFVLNLQWSETAANAAAADVRSKDTKVKLSVSIQVDNAWGKLLNDSYKGIDKDLVDFHLLKSSVSPRIRILHLTNLLIFHLTTIQNWWLEKIFLSLLQKGMEFCPDNSFKQTTAGSNHSKKNTFLPGKIAKTGQCHCLFSTHFTDIDLSSLPPSIPHPLLYSLILD